MAKKSAGILLYRIRKDLTEIFLVHPGGPFWKNKDLGAWTIPKGEFTDEETGLAAARRELKEETGHDISGNFIALSPVKLKSGKTVFAWAVEGNLDTAKFRCETFIDLEWPPRTGKIISIPEVDKGGWFSPQDAKAKINPAQAALIDELLSLM